MKPKTFEPGHDQEFPADAFLLDINKYTEDELTKVNEDKYPLIIKMENDKPEARERIYVYCTLVHKGEKYKPHIVKQKLERNGKSYLLNDVYEIVPEFADEPGKKDCTICLEKPIDTIVLPCRHMFLCSACSNNFQVEDQRKCSICRKPIKTFVRIKYPEAVSEDRSPTQQ